MYAYVYMYVCITMFADPERDGIQPISVLIKHYHSHAIMICKWNPLSASVRSLFAFCLAGDSSFDIRHVTRYIQRVLYTSCNFYVYIEIYIQIYIQIYVYVDVT